MSRFKRITRLFVLTLFIVIASLGLGIPIPNFRENYIDHEVKIELVEEKKDEENEPGLE